MKKHWLWVFTAAVLLLAQTSAVFSETEAERKVRVDKWDKKNLRYSTGVATDTSREFIKIPEDYPGKRDFVMSKNVPTIDFAPTAHRTVMYS